MSGVLVVGPNLCLDRTVRLAELRPGFVQRPFGAVETAGGKAVNVVRALHALGHRPMLVGPLPADGADRFTALLSREQVLAPGGFVPVPMAGALRAATILLEDSGRVTVLNEPGPQASAADLDRLLAALAAGPDLITPNLAEADGVLGGGGTGVDEAVEAGEDVAERATDAVRALDQGRAGDLLARIRAVAPVRPEPGR